VALCFAFWDDRKLAERSSDARLLFAFLVSTRDAVLPGLLHVGPGGLREKCRIAACVEALAELEGAGFVEVDRTDAENWFIRVPKAPRYEPPFNEKHLLSWWRQWRKLAASPLRSRHVESIFAARFDEKGIERSWFASAWAKTFGTLSVTSSAPVSPPVTVPIPYGIPYRDGIDTNPIPTRTRSGSLSRSLELVSDPDGTAPLVVERPWPKVWAELFFAAHGEAHADRRPGDWAEKAVCAAVQSIGSPRVQERMRRFFADERRSVERKTLEHFANDMEQYTDGAMQSRATRPGYVKVTDEPKRYDDGGKF
jgi:hypothetical protein